VLVLPFKYRINYAALLSAARRRSRENTAGFLERRLPSVWHDAYVSTISHEANLVCFRHRTFEYICDLYSQLEITGSVAFDQTVTDRVIGVFGKSSGAQQERKPLRVRLELPEELEGTARDDGHFIAHSIGGGFDMNLFSQERKLNRGWSAQGKIYREMEKYCGQREGTFCFSRPIYTDSSNVPRWLEFGVLKSDDTLWVEVFEN